MLGLLLVACLQDPFPKPGHDPEGVVVDESGKPVEGAQVEILGRFPESPFARSVHGVLSRTPLPRATSDREGHFVLPLSGAQRSLGTQASAAQESFVLVATKAGHRTWQEPLTAGLRDFVGSRVVLPRLAAVRDLEDLPWPPTIQIGNGTASDMLVPLGAGPEVSWTRMPPALRPATARGPHRLRLLVRTEDGTRVPHAWLRLGNSFLEAASLADATTRTDDAGTFAVEGLPESATDGEIEVLGENGEAFYVLDKHRSTGVDGVLLEVVVERVQLVRSRTVDSEGSPVPFAPVMVVHGGKARMTPLTSDSQGRLVLEGKPGPESVLGQPAHGLLGEFRSANDLVEIRVARQVAVLLLTDPCSSLDAEWTNTRRGARGSRGKQALGKPCERFFLWWLAEPGEQFVLREGSTQIATVAYEGLEIRDVAGFPFARWDARSAIKR